MKRIIIAFTIGCAFLGNVFSHTGVNNYATSLDTTLIPLRWNLGRNPVEGGYNRRRSPIVLPEATYDGAFIVLSSANGSSYTYSICKGEEIVESGTIMLQPRLDTRINTVSLEPGLYRIEIYIGSMTFYAEFYK